MKSYVITSIEDYEPWRAFLLGVLEELKKRHEVKDPARTLAEIERRHDNNGMACKTWLVIDKAKVQGWKKGLLGLAQSFEDSVSAVLVTDVTVDEAGDRWLHLWLGWIRKGEHAAPMKFGLNAIDDVARKMGCIGVTASSGRRGYDRWIAQFGFKVRTVFFEKPLAR